MSCLVALELVLLAVGVLHLDGYMTNSKLILTDLANLLENELGVLSGFDVAAHYDFSLCNGPDMKVVHLHFWIALFNLLN